MSCVNCPQPPYGETDEYGASIVANPLRPMNSLRSCTNMAVFSW